MALYPLRGNRFFYGCLCYNALSATRKRDFARGYDCSIPLGSGVVGGWVLNHQGFKNLDGFGLLPLWLNAGSATRKRGFIRGYTCLIPLGSGAAGG